MKLSTRFSSWVVLLIFVLSIQLTAQWSTNPAVNNAISVLSNDQTNPVIVGDGLGGAIIAWSDYRSGSTYDIYAQKISASGIVQWSTNGVAICTASWDQLNPAIVSDGSGGAIITWQDIRSLTNYDIYAQRINAEGVVQWTVNGVAICTLAGHQNYPKMVIDGSGGAVITWNDNGGNIYSQKINSIGTVQWASNGAVICAATNTQTNSVIAEDGSGGAIIAWEDLRSGTNNDIYSQRISSSGTVQWAINGVVITNAVDNQGTPVITKDGYGGAIISWNDLRNTVSTYYDIYSQRVSSSGAVLWTANGVVISAEASEQSNPTVTSDGSGGAIIAWRDNRNGNYDIFSQRINYTGITAWTANGVAVSVGTGNQLSPIIISDGVGGSIIEWYDNRNGNNDIYAQKMSSSGAAQWTTNGKEISSAIDEQSQHVIVHDENGGAICAWYDFRNGNYDIYAQRIDPMGNLYSAPLLNDIGDVSNDQGGKLRLFWDPQYLDNRVNQTVTSYTIKIGAKTTGILGKASESNSSGIYWQTAGTVRADRSEGYTTVVSSYADSGLQGIPMYYFQVIAKNADSTVWWYSNIDSGYSIDNIPPVGVGNALIASNGGGILLKWNKNRVDKDLMEYRIYRSTFPAFSVGSGTLLSTTTDTSYTDASGTNGTSYFYRIAAVDVHGNVGSPSNELNETALSLELTSFAVSANRRNANIAWSVATETNNFGYEIERRAASDRHLEGDGHLAWTKVGFVEGIGTSQTARQYSFSDKNVGSGIFSYRLKQIDRNGQYTFSHAVEVTMGVAPKEFELAQNYPNPFNPTTNIEFTVPVTGQATLKIFNAIGQEVATLFDGIADAGQYHQTKFDAKDLASGIYLARLVSGEKSQVKKLMLMK